MIRPSAIAPLAFATGALLPGMSAAQDLATPVAATSVTDLAGTAERSSPFAAEAVDDSMLRSIAGREDVTQVSQAQQTAGVSRNSVGDHSITGEARIDGNAFQNMSGLSILSVNTGNNVAINAAMNVNVSIVQPQ